MRHDRRLVVFSPMPPAQNGIADYWDELLPELAQEFDITCVVDDGQPRMCPGTPHADVIHLSEYLWMSAQYSADLHLYHLGNNPGHVYMLPVMLMCPGVIVLHDLTLHYLIDCATLRWGDTDAYAYALQAEYGEAGHRLADQLRQGHPRETAMFYELPMTRLIASHSRAVIVHSQYAKVKLLARAPSARVTVVPHHLSRQVARTLETLTPLQARMKLGLPPHELLLVSLGFITPAKQIDKILAALARVRRQLPPFRYILAGNCDPGEYDVWAEIGRYGLEDIVTVTGYLSEAEFFVYARAAHVVLNLRYPTGGETSGTLIRALGLGACVVVIDVGPFSELPDSTCVKLPWGPEVASQLSEVLLRLGNNPDARAAVGAAATRFAHEVHSVRRSALGYLEVLGAAEGSDVRPWVPARPLLFPAVSEASAIMFKAKSQGVVSLPLWFRETLVPLAQGLGESAVVASEHSEALPFLLEALDYNPELTFHVPFDALIHRLQRLARGSLSLVVLDDVEVAWLEQEGGAALDAVGTCLRIGGALVLATRVRAEEPLPAVVAKTEDALRRHGFHTLRSATVAAQLLDVSDPAEQAASPSWCAVKVSDVSGGWHWKGPSQASRA